MLLKHLSKKGFVGFPTPQLSITPEFALERVTMLCEAFYKNVKSKSKESNPKTAQKSDFTTHPWDADGYLIPPVHINSLTIWNFGQVTAKPGFHSDKNFFPIGWVSVRDHMSMWDPTTRSSYWCSIEETNDKPVFRISCEEEGLDEVCQTTTACW